MKRERKETFAATSYYLRIALHFSLAPSWKDIND